MPPPPDPNAPLPPDAEPAPPPLPDPSEPTGHAAALGPEIIDTGLCIACGADLAGHAIGAPCPVCATPAARSGFDIFIVKDHPCLSCGYSLAGLSSNSCCPECGTPIVRSLQGNLLRFCSRDYLHTLYRGVLLAEISIVAGVCLLFVAGFASRLVISNFNISTGGKVPAAVDVGVAVLSFIGWWMFSTPDPAYMGEDRAIGARRLLRVSLIIAIVLAVGRFVLSVAPLPAALLPEPNTTLAMSTRIGTSLLYLGGRLLGFFSSLFYLTSVARRIPDKPLEASAQRLMWLGPLISVLLCVLGWIIAWVLYLVAIDRTRTLLKRTLDTLPPSPSTPS